MSPDWRMELNSANRTKKRVGPASRLKGRRLDIDVGCRTHQKQHVATFGRDTHKRHTPVSNRCHIFSRTRSVRDRGYSRPTLCVGHLQLFSRPTFCVGHPWPIRWPASVPTAERSRQGPSLVRCSASDTPGQSAGPVLSGTRSVRDRGQRVLSRARSARDRTTSTTPFFELA